jgi:hypothetical protein
MYFNCVIGRRVTQGVIIIQRFLPRVECITLLGSLQLLAHVNIE